MNPESQNQFYRLAAITHADYRCKVELRMN